MGIQSHSFVLPRRRKKSYSFNPSLQRNKPPSPTNLTPITRLGRFNSSVDYGKVSSCSCAHPTRCSTLPPPPRGLPWPCWQRCSLGSPWSRRSPDSHSLRCSRDTHRSHRSHHPPGSPARPGRSHLAPSPPSAPGAPMGAHRYPHFSTTYPIRQHPKPPPRPPTLLYPPSQPLDAITFPML